MSYAPKLWMCVCVLAQFGYVQVDSFGRVLENGLQRRSALILGLEFVLGPPGALGHRFSKTKIWDGNGHSNSQPWKFELGSAQLKFLRLRIWMPIPISDFRLRQYMSPCPGISKHEFQTETLCWAPLASILKDPTRAVDLDIPKAQRTVEGCKTNIYVFVKFWMVGSLRFPPRGPGLPQ
jgi:hypothetical protein